MVPRGFPSTVPENPEQPLTWFTTLRPVTSTFEEKVYSAPGLFGLFVLALVLPAKGQFAVHV